MHNKYTLTVTLNEMNGLKKLPHCIRKDKCLCNVSNLLIYSSKFKNRLTQFSYICITMYLYSKRQNNFYIQKHNERSCSLGVCH